MKFSFDKYLLGSLCLFGVASFLSIAAANIFLGISTLLYLILAIKHKKLSISDNYISYLKVVGIFTLAVFFSALFSGNIVYGLKGWAGLCIWRFMPFVIVISLLDDKLKADKIFKAISFGFLLDCLYAIYQGVFIFNLNIYGRSAGFVGGPMTIAGWACIILPVLLILIYRRDISKGFHWFYVISFIIFSLALVFNATRGAWLALAIVLPIVSMPFILRSKKAFIAFVSVLLVLGIAIVNNPLLMNRVNSITNTETDWSNASRFVIWNTTYDIFKENPVFGIGFGQFKQEYRSRFIVSEDLKKEVAQYDNYVDNKKANKLTKEQKEYSNEKLQSLWRAKDKVSKINHLKGLQHAHNNIMQMLGENGLVGLVGYIAAFGFILWENIKNYFMNQNPYALMIVGSTLALQLQGLTEYNFGNGAVMKIYWLILACLIVLANAYNKEKCENKTK